MTGEKATQPGRVRPLEEEERGRELAKRSLEAENKALVCHTLCYMPSA